MAKVHPSTAGVPEPAARLAASPAADDQEPTVLTVWRKSLLFKCDGFTIFEAKGNLAFRVYCYGNGRCAEVVLMDVAGAPLLTVRRERLSLAEHCVEHLVEGDHEGHGQRRAKTRVSHEPEHVVPHGLLAPHLGHRVPARVAHRAAPPVVGALHHVRLSGGGARCEGRDVRQCLVGGAEADVAADGEERRGCAQQCAQPKSVVDQVHFGVYQP